MEKYIVLQGFYDCYAISNKGNLKNLRTNHILKPSTNKDGYKSVLLSKNGKKMSIRIHRLVALYFLENPNKYPDVNHKNGIKDDNRVENLEWCSKSMNMRHAYDTGLIKGNKNKEILVFDKDTKEHLFTFESVSQCSKMLNLNDSPIYRVLKGKRSHHKGFIFKYVDRIK